MTIEDPDKVFCEWCNKEVEPGKNGYLYISTGSMVGRHYLNTHQEKAYCCGPESLQEEKAVIDQTVEVKVVKNRVLNTVQNDLRATIRNI